MHLQSFPRGQENKVKDCKKYIGERELNMKRIFIALFCLCIFLMAVSSAIESSSSVDASDTSSLASGKPSIPSKPLAPEESLWTKRWRECPEATEIWLIMEDFGWSDAAKAGVLGNIMREVGGNTLRNINHTLYGGNGKYFGLCQWYLEYYPAIRPIGRWTPSVREQMEFLRHTIINYNGYGYVYNFDEDYLRNATDVAEVARVFCEGYERPNESAERRQELALIAYEYFTNDTP